MLLLTTPAQHEGANPAVLLEEKQLQKWLAGLPVMNVEQTVTALHQALVPFNELQLDNSLRLKLLEQYRQAIDEIFYSYDDMRLKQLPVSHESRQAIKADIMWLYLELANGYKVVVKNAVEQGQNPRKDANELLAIYRAMEQIIHALVNAYRNHQAPPPLACLEINQLYQVADQQGAIDKKISSARQESATPTINNLYKQFMLLALADPMNLPEGVAFELFFILEPFARQTRISDKPSGEKWLFAINLAEDRLPQPVPASAGGGGDESDTRYLDASEVIKVIDERVEALQQSQQDLMETQEIKLLQLFSRQASGNTAGTGGMTGKAAASRKQVQLSFGLEATHYFMTANHYAEYQSAGTESFGIEVRDVDHREDLFELETWLITETGKSGRMLLIPRDITYQDFEIGQLIGIFQQIGEDKPPVFTLGTLRWLPPPEHEETKIGLQIIPGRPQPVLCLEPSGDSPVHCLHMPPVAVLQQPASLIVPSSVYRPGKSVAMQRDKEPRQVCLGELIDQTAYVCQCVYQ